MAADLRRNVSKLAGLLGLRPIRHRLHEWQAARAAADFPAADEHGLPLPSAFLMMKVVGHTDWRRFVETGKDALGALKDAVDRNGGDFASAGRILDFGCGCGRLARHLPAMTSAEAFGVDYNSALAGWCAQYLKGSFTRNGSHPPLDFPDAHFDIVYLLSVFTHQRLATQNAWLAEFARILKPGGFALVTFHDEDHPGVKKAGLAPSEVVSRGFVVHNDAAEGSNFMATFQTGAHLRQQATAHFETLEIVPRTATPLGQTIAVLRKPGRSGAG